MLYQDRALKVIDTEIDAIKQLKKRIDNTFDDACKLLHHTTGRIIVIGMGKSGHIGKKIAATLASTGSPAFFVHPAEASHGDLGMLTKGDVVISISYSGKTEEVLTLLPLIARLGVPMVSITGDKTSPLATAAIVHLDVHVEKEACPLGLAPTASTTATLVLGDAIAVALLEARGFTSEDFALSHPGGALGKRLLIKVKDIMHTGDTIPRVTPGTPLKDAMLEMTDKSLGMTTITDKTNTLLGIYTDGDVRRTFEQDPGALEKPISNFMIVKPKVTSADDLAAKALGIMEQYKITSLVAADKDNQIQGVLHMHALLRAGVM